MSFSLRKLLGDELSMIDETSYIATHSFNDHLSIDEPNWFELDVVLIGRLRLYLERFLGGEPVFFWQLHCKEENSVEGILELYHFLYLNVYL